MTSVTGSSSQIGHGSLVAVPAPTAAQVAAAAAVVDGARRPALLVGVGLEPEGAYLPLRRLAEMNFDRP